MNCLKVRNWDKLQQYKDGRPVHWIKLYVEMLDDYEFDHALLFQRRNALEPFRTGHRERAHAPALDLLGELAQTRHAGSDVTADDRLGLLHDLTRTIAEHGYEIYISKAANIRDQVADTFYLKDADGRKLGDREAIERLRLDLLEAAKGGAGSDAG